MIWENYIAIPTVLLPIIAVDPCQTKNAALFVGMIASLSSLGAALGVSVISLLKSSMDFK